MADHPLDAVTSPLFFRLLIRSPVRLRGHRILQQGVFRADVPVSIDHVPQEAVEIAYRVKESRGGKPHSFSIVRFRGRLFWPLHSPSGSAKTTLSAAQRGAIDLFGTGLIAAPDEIDGEDLRIAEVCGDHNPTLAEIHRKAADLLVVGDELYAAGGIPVVALINGQPVVISTGASRDGRPLTNGLALQPGGFGRPETDFALSARQFWLAGEFADPKAGGLKAPLTSAVAIEEIAPEPLDIFRVRLDAAFRQIDAAARRRTKELWSWRWDDLDFTINGALHDAPDVDERRIEVIYDALTLLGGPWFDFAFPGHSAEISNLIEVGIARGLKKPKLRIGSTLLKEDDDAALAGLFE